MVALFSMADMLIPSGMEIRISTVPLRCVDAAKVKGVRTVAPTLAHIPTCYDVRAGWCYQMGRVISVADWHLQADLSHIPIFRSTEMLPNGEILHQGI